MGGQESRQISRDGRIGGKRQAEFLKARLPAGRLVIQTNRGKKPSTSRSRTSWPVTSTWRPPPINREPAPGRLTVSLSGASGPKSVSFTARQVRTSTAHCRGSNLVPSLLFDVFGQRQVEIVAAEDQMIAHGHAMELHLAAFAAADADQREIGRAAADIADQNFLARLDQSFPIVLMRVNPGVKGGLRLFDQHHPRQAGQGRRFDGQFAGHLVERGRQREHEILLFQRLAREFGVPGVAHVGQIPGTDFDRREPLDVFGPVPGQQRRRAIHARVTQPRLGRVDQPPRRQRAVIAGKKTHGIAVLVGFAHRSSLRPAPLAPSPFLNPEP